MEADKKDRWNIITKRGIGCQMKKKELSVGKGDGEKTDGGMKFMNYTNTHEPEKTDMQWWTVKVYILKYSP